MSGWPNRAQRAAPLRLLRMVQAVDHNNAGSYHIARTHFDEPVTDFRMRAN